MTPFTDVDGYRAVWQTWKIARQSAVPTTLAAPVKPSGDAGHGTHATLGEDANATSINHAEEEFRHRVQRARLANRWSVADIAGMMTHCDVATIAAFERGKAALPAGAQRELRRILSLT